ncbi:hypothetical protein Tco_0982282, partial [Tanacetum coccineum]
NVHAIQVGCRIYEGAHLDKECPLNEEVKRVEEVKYGEFGRSFPNNGRNRARHRVSKKGNKGPSGVLPCQLPPKELSPWSFTLPCTISSLNMYALAYLVNIMPYLMFKCLKLTTPKETRDPNKTIILGRPFLATIQARTNVFRGEISLGIREDRILFDMNGNVHHPTIPIEKVYMTNSIQEEKSFNPLEICEDLFSYDSPLCLEFEKYNYPYDTNQNNEDTFVCDDIVQEPVTGRNGKTMMAEPGMVT